jgi:Ca-activated chloride channel family protein
MRAFVYVIAVILLTGSSVLMQKRGDDDVIRVDIELIDVPVVVTDRAGKPILNLKQSNFAIYEDGKPQEIEGFSTTNAPFEVALLLDTSGSTRGDLEMIRRAAQNFIASLRPGDRVAIIAFRSTVVDDRAAAASEIISELTSDRRELSLALQRVSTSNGTPYYDGLVEIADKVFGETPTEAFRGRRALVALTDGVDSTSAAGFDEIKSKFVNSGISAYFIQVDTRPFFEENLLGDCEGATRFSQAQIRRYYASFSSKANIERTSDFCRLGDFERLAISKRLYELADTEMSALAKLSGGRVFPAASLSDAGGAFQMVADEIGTKYSLGYYSSNEKRDGKFRSIKVELKGLPAGTAVRAREGYTAPLK